MPRLEQIAKQVIVMRTDLNMRKGKMVAQGAHASLATFMWAWEGMNGSITGDLVEARDQWIEGTFTKVCVRVDSETELMRIFGEASAAKLPVKLITDAGHTEFHGVPTRTCLAIGPAWSDDIDKITGGLTLL